jgi:peptide/nickel transport system substrate-binding protein
MNPNSLWRQWPLLLFTLIGLVSLACSSASTPTSTSPQQASTSNAPTPTRVPGATPTLTPVPTVAPAATPLPSNVTSARDTLRLVVDSEPITMNPMVTTAGLTGAVNKDNLVDPLTWQSGDDLRIVPTTATTGWEQLNESQWRFHLRQGVKFHNGEPWNAQAAIPLIEFQGVGTNDNSSFAYTGGIKGQVVDDYTLDLLCDTPCPILPNTSFFLTFEAPEWFAGASEEELTRNAVGFGPYKLTQWDAGVSVTQEAYEDYVPAGDHFEFQKPYIKNLTWYWRGEPTVAAAMVQSGEADIVWDVGVDAGDALPENMLRSGGSAEVFVLRPNALWHPELQKKAVRQAITHAINCQEIVDSLYGGRTRCLGNIIWPGVIGATEENSAPYQYDPELAQQLLEEANYDPSNQITITGRGTRIPKQVEVYEAVVGYLDQVGMSVDVNVVDASVWRDTRLCGIGRAVNDVLIASGRDPDKDKPTMEDFAAAKAKGGASCAQADLTDDAPSNETLDFGRQLNRYMTCLDQRSTFCDPSPGGVEETIPIALAASGQERQDILQRMADIHREEVVHIPLFELPVSYAVDPKLNWKPRFDRRVRASSMWFSP